MTDANFVLVQGIRELSADVTASLYQLVGCVYNEEDAEKMQLGLTKYLLESASQIMVNNYNRFADGRSLFYLASRSLPDDVEEYDRQFASDIEDGDADDDDDSEDSEDLAETEAADEADLEEPEDESEDESEYDEEE